LFGSFKIPTFHGVDKHIFLLAKFHRSINTNY
jgi:hypothetical protein